VQVFAPKVATASVVKFALWIDVEAHCSLT
jgi:hypothetical protein